MMEENKTDNGFEEEMKSVNAASAEDAIAAAEPISKTEPTPPIINQPKTEAMEVHHHSHQDHGKKNWKSYFWEFLMLFLAVFCGFLAEYQLEHKIERDRAKELAKSFYEELKNDSVNVQIKTKNRIRQEEALKYLERYFNDSSLTNVSKEFQLNFFYGIMVRTPSMFEPRTVVLEQLKNSGSLRYFKNDEMQKLVGDLMVAINNIYDRQALESEIRTKYIFDIIIRHYDYSFDDALKRNDADFMLAVEDYEKSDRFIPFEFKSIEKFDKQGTINAIGLLGRNALNSTRRVHYQKYVEINAALLGLLRKEYRLQE